MKVAIFGSGFGLYCYLPTLMLGCGQKVILPERYRQPLLMRSDVGPLAEAVEWAPSDEQALERADTVVVAQRPADQFRRVCDCLPRDNIRSLILEKPLAPDPDSAQLMLKEIERARKDLCIGYIFRHTEWGRALRAYRASAAGSIRINWRFRAHHYLHRLMNWKRTVSAGGGALRFYGIHLIALLAEIGYDRVVSSCVVAQSPDEAETWQAIITGSDRPECHVHVETNCPDRAFTITMEHRSVDHRLHFELSDPLEIRDNGRTGLDPRVTILTEMCSDFFHDKGRSINYYPRSVSLWRSIEANTKIAGTCNPLQ